MNELRGKHVAVLVCDGFEEAELTEPVKALREAGAEVEIYSQKAGAVRAFKHHDPSREINVDATFERLDPQKCDAVLLPGGALNSDQLRVIPEAQKFVKAMYDQRKPMAVICHAPWILASTGIARGKKLTSFHAIADDMRNAGANWVDQEVVVDDNLVTSRKPDDIPAFNREFISLLAQVPAQA